MAIGALVVVVVVAATVIVLRLYAPSAGQQNTDSPGGRDGSPTAAEPTDAAATGCLGGESRDAAMVRAAQDAAGQTEGGAVEVAAAFVRWLNQYPYPEGAEQVQQSSLSAEAPTRDLVAFFATEPDLSGGLVERDEPYWLSTVSGVYFVESADDDSVTASIGTALVTDGELSPTLKGSITVTVAWENDQWAFVRSEGTRTTEDLFAIGTPFSGGC
ncbi:hypothetical protein GCM10010979_12140 [Conyzicola nivalis]|uniref:Uncharacterized protein n=1 Tax=Conyzicola nivalis TaxID=1477021 RepID=A0A916WH60_9MICO|nr:hypothetical protein GCM10010979_12140 [Conyzicola nivalis]